MFNKEFKYILLITIIFIAACIETDIYLPAFPDMMAYFSISEEKIQSLLTWNFIGICLSGPFYGPVSDAIGRKKPLIFALALFLIGSLLTIFAVNFDGMLFGRILQGLGSGGCFTLGTAILFDAFQEKKAIEALNKLNTIIPLIMASAPMLGGFLNHFYGFRSNFIAITCFVLMSLLICLFYFEESLPVEKLAPLKLNKVLGDFKRVCTSLQFWQMTIIISLMFGGYIAFLSGAAVLFVLEFGISKQMLPIFQGILLGAWVGANLAFNRAIEKFGIPVVKKIGTYLVIISGIGVLGAILFDPTDPYLVTVFMMTFAFGANWIQGIYFPEGMELFPDIKGVTASLLTSARLLLVAIMVGISSALYNGTIYPIIGVVFGSILIILTTIVFYEKGRSGRTVVMESSGSSEVHTMTH